MQLNFGDLSEAFDTINTTTVGKDIVYNVFYNIYSKIFLEKNNIKYAKYKIIMGKVRVTKVFYVCN